MFMEILLFLDPVFLEDGIHDRISKGSDPVNSDRPQKQGNFKYLENDGLTGPGAWNQPPYGFLPLSK